MPRRQKSMGPLRRQAGEAAVGAALPPQDQAAAERDSAAHARDLAALARDQLAELRDRSLAERDAAQAQVAPATDEARRVAHLRGKAAEQRALAAVDREHAARDREAAARDRLRAAADRAASARRLDSITDADAVSPPPPPDLTELQAEIDRAHRSGARLVVAYVDVVALRSLDDVDRTRALNRVVGVIRNHLRSYDRIVRIGGEGFMCAISGVEVVDARRRFAAIEHELARDASEAPIEAGFVAVEPGDSAAQLVQRVDAAVARRG